MSETDSSSTEWEGVEDKIEDVKEETSCLFCPNLLGSPEETLDHCKSLHSFDLVSFNKILTLDAVSYIKLINYIRSEKPLAKDLLPNINKPPAWNSDSFMKPVNPLDPLLTFDIESYLQENAAMNAEEEKETITIPKSDYKSLVDKVSAMEAQLQNAFDRIDRMKETARNVLCSENKVIEKQNYQAEVDSYYFSSYDHFGIHHEMLQDKVRTLAYRDAILNNRELFANKKVMDLGCGTAILSMFAATAGAVKVYAIEKSDVIYQAMDIIRENDFNDTIDLFKGRLEDVTLPEEKVDIIISEWMGYFLLFEGMLDSVLYARDKYLTPSGLIFPDRCTLSVGAVSDIQRYNECIKFWDDVYGYKMSVMQREVIKEANVESVKADLMCSHPVVIKELDLMTCKVEDTEFVSKFTLSITRDCNVTGLFSYFDCMFEKNLINKITMSTSPWTEQTHWKQTTFLLPKPVAVKAGDEIPCRLSCRRNRRDPRSLVVKIDFGSVYNQYYLA